jgi:predicted NUDIX family phosphoesterase
MVPKELVLVFESRVFERLGTFRGLNFDVERYLSALFAPGVLRFMPRSQVESDPGYKQLIPYVIMTHGGKYLSYVRGKKAGEKRLVGLRSIGIGGHINPDDQSLFHRDHSADFRQMYLTAVEREVAEEVSVEATHSDRIVALLNDDSNEVGRVHLGIVHYWVLDSPKVSKREQMITQMAFMGADELQELGDTFETWSGLCVAGLEEMAKRAECGIRLEALFDKAEGRIRGD